MPISIDNSNYIKDDYGRVSQSGNTADHVRNDHYAARESLTSGSTVTGEIIEKNGDQVTIRMSNDQTISAKLSSDANIEVGMKLTFEVAKGANDQTQLRPLFSNLTNNSAAMTALRAAGLPINNTTLAMTDRMMTESMPVNRNALMAMFRNVTTHQNASVDSIVQMTKLNMPLTESNVIQFENYRNFEHRITSDLQNVSDGIADLFKEAVSGLSPESGATQAFAGMTPGEVINEVLNLIDTDALDTIMPDNVVGTSAEGVAVSEETQQAVESKTADGAAIQTGEQAIAETDENAVIHTSGHPAAAIKNSVEGFISGLKEMFIPDAPDGQMADNAASINANLSLSASEQSSLASDLQNILILAGQSTDIHEPLDPSQIMTAVKKLVNEYPPENVQVDKTELGAYSEEGYESYDETRLINTAQGDIDALRHNDEADTANIKAKITQKLNDLIKSDGFTKLVKDSVKAQMSIKPQDVAQNGKIEELYENIRKTSTKISQLMESIGRADSSVAQSSAALNENVNFMNQLSEFVNYVQLPLKMAGEDANGELYVYTNKKNLADRDGNYSALLHLDMEHLGPMDVYVTMRDHTKVSTNFYLQTEELLDFIESHIGELTKRLTEKGYSANTKVTQKDPNKPITPVADEFTKDEVQAESQVVVSRMRFDVRA